MNNGMFESLFNDTAFTWISPLGAVSRAEIGTRLRIAERLLIAQWADFEREVVRAAEADAVG